MLRILVLGSVLMLPACATIVKGSTQTVNVDSAPTGGSCTLDRTGARLGAIPSTPGSVLLQRSNIELVVTCNKDGFLTTSKTVTGTFNGATFGNILFGGIVGAVVDASSGANYSYPETVMVELASNPALQPAPSGPVAYTPGAPIRLAPMAKPVSMTTPGGSDAAGPAPIVR